LRSLKGGGLYIAGTNLDHRLARFGVGLPAGIETMKPPGDEAGDGEWNAYP
jgi:hypothetical protein